MYKIKLFNSAVDAWNTKFQANAEKARLPDIKFSEEFQPPYQVWKPPIGIGTEIQFLDSDREKTWRGIISGMISSDMISSREDPIYSVEGAVSDNGEEAGCFPWIKNKDIIKVL